jgi:hypothetical protein
MIERIDAWLIARVYQPMVDLFEKKPQWWVEQCSMALLLSAVMVSMWRDSGSMQYVRLATDVLCAALFVAYARMPVLFEWLAKADFTRRFLLILDLPLMVLILIPTKDYSYAINVADISNSIAFLSVYYFAACRPPKPREPKRRLVPSPTS